MSTAGIIRQELEKEVLFRQVMTALDSAATEGAGKRALRALELRLAQEACFGRIESFRARLTTGKGI